MASTFPCLSTNPKHPLFSPRFPIKIRPSAFKIVMLDRQAHRTSIDADISSYILKSLPASQPAAVTEPMRHLVSAASSTMAPALCIAACELVGGRKETAMPVACALRLMHSAVYTRGRFPALAGPKRNHASELAAAFPLGVELLTVDGMLSLAYEVVARSECDPERAMMVVVEIAETMGSRGMVEWQLMEAETRGEEALGEGKEGRLLACGAACGAILGGGSEDAVERLRRCGMYVGMMQGGRGTAEELRALAQLELQGFEVGKADAIRMLLGLW